MSKIKVTNIQNPSSGTDDIQIDADGSVTIGGLSLDAAAAAGSVNLDSSGRLLVGTSTAPTGTNTQYTKLGVFGNSSSATTGLLSLSYGAAATSLTTGFNIGRIFFGDTGAAEFGYISCEVDGTSGSGDYPGRLVFSTTADGASSPTERMRITRDGGMKASTNGSYYAPTSSYHELYQSNNNWYTTIFTNSAAPNPYGIAIGFTSASPDNNTETFISCFDSTATRMRVYADGDVWTSDAGTLTSDITLKRDITDASPKLADVMNLRVRNFYWQEDYHPNKQDKKLIGFIAQEFEEVFPGLVSEHKIKGGESIFDEDGNDTGEKTPEVFKKGIKEAKLVPILVKALQEAVERIETLEAKVAALETP